MTFHTEILTKGQDQLLRRLGPWTSRHRFYLAGGTAVALHLGHRRSRDFDWFTAEPFGDALALAQEIRREKIHFSIGSIAPATLNGRAFRIRTSFLGYRYPLLEPVQMLKSHGCALASLPDLACMKMSAVAQRGSKKDFVDLHTLGIQAFGLKEMLAMYQQKYAVADVAHLLYALSYFDDADRDRSPVLLHAAKWRTVKLEIAGWVKDCL